MSRQEGVTVEQLAALADFEHTDVFDDRERAVLRYTVAMTATPVDVSAELFAELRRHFDDRQLVELTSCIAWENYRARFDHALSIESAGFSEGGFCPLPQVAPSPPNDASTASDQVPSPKEEVSLPPDEPSTA